MDVKNLAKHAAGIEKYFTLTENTYAKALAAAVNIIISKKKKATERGEPALSRRYILFVPDKYTLLAEKMLYGDGAGSFDCEVLTINRLCFAVADRAGYVSSQKPLSRLGAVLTVRKILEENADKLGCFSRSARFAGFGEIMYDNISQFETCGITPDDIPDDGEDLLHGKLKSIKFVYSEFNKAVENKFVDAAGRLLLLYKLLCSDSGYFEDCDVVFACYDDFTPLTARIVKKICDVCGDGHADIINAECALDIAGCEIEEYEAVSQADELKAAAERIRKYALGGASYGDMGVIASGADNNRLKRIFDEYGVPYFSDEKYALSSHPLARYFTDLFTAANSGTNESYIKLSKNPYSGVSPYEADTFENFIYNLSMRDWAVRSPFDITGITDASITEMHSVAERVRKILWRKTSDVNVASILTGNDFVRAIEKAMPPCEAEISAEYAEKFPNAREEIITAISVIAEVFLSPSDFTVMLGALKECFALKEVGVIPNKSGRVEVGDVSTFRAGVKKYLFVLGMHEGELPAVKADGGLLSDSEISEAGKLALKRIKIEPSVETLNRRAEEELDSVLSGAKKLFVSYLADAAVSPTLIRIRNMLRQSGGGITACSSAAEREALTCDDGRPNISALCDMCPTPAAALELCLIGDDDLKAGGEGYGFEPELHALLGDTVPFHGKTEFDVFGADRLYYGKRMSVSRVQEYFACPFRFFMRYGLKAKRRPDGNVSPLDLGTLFHRVIELFISGGDFTNPAVTVRALMEKIRGEEPQLFKGMSESFIGELTDEAVKLSAVAAAQIQSGDFKAEFTEVSFGKADSPLKGINAALSCGNVTAEGVIDRMDVFGAHDGVKGAVRVVDYKTGFVKFDLSDIYYGRKIQLPIYLKVAEANGYTPAGMFYFPFSSGFTEDEKSYRLMGLYDVNYAKEMDNKLVMPNTSSDVVAARSTKDSSPQKVTLNKRYASGVESETLGAVCDYAEAVFCEGAEEALSGYCAPSPLGGGKTGECAYCEFRAVCSAHSAEKIERGGLSIGADFFVETIKSLRGKCGGET